MRPVLGVAVDDGEITAALVDADVTLLGPFDSQRWPADPDVTTPDAVAAAVAAMSERAEAASVTVDRIGIVTASGAGPADDLVAAVAEVTAVPVDVVPLDRARLVFLGGAHELADHTVIAVHTRTDDTESVSIVDIRSATVLSSVVRDGDAVTGHVESLPDVADEAVARAGAAPQALVFLDLRPGDGGPARELATVLGVPFVAPHGVPWHRATGAALVAAAQDPPTATATAAGGRRPAWVLVCVLGVLTALLGGGLAVGVGGAARSGDQLPATVTETMVPVPPPAGESAPAGEESSPAPDPCAEDRPVSWPSHRSDPDSGPVPGDVPEPAGDPCGDTVSRQP